VFVNPGAKLRKGHVPLSSHTAFLRHRVHSWKWVQSGAPRSTAILRLLSAKSV
jgi:hypothetical protein